MSKATFRQAYFSGLRATLPAAPGTATFGMICGAAMVGAGMPPLVAIAAGAMVFAGTLQLAAVQLLATGAPLLLIVVAGVVVNLRFVMFSASIAPYLRKSSLFRRIIMTYTLSDNGYASSYLHFSQPAEERKSQAERDAYYFGAATSIWVAWQVATVIGVLVGAAIPPQWRLEFTVSLTFTALGLANIRDRPTLAAAIAAGATAVATHALPFRLGLILGAAAGIAAGMLTERMKER